jgi:hypothetical protein
MVEGVWTSYNHTLDRTVLKKRTFLEPPAPKAPRPVPPAHQATVAGPVAGPVVAQPKREVDSASPFAAKLHQALRREQ